MGPSQSVSQAILAIDHIGRLVTCGGEDALGVIPDAAVVITGRRIVALGPRQDVVPPGGWRSGIQVIDAGGRVVLPGFVDCHTHLCFAGERRGEYQARVGGASYQELAARGGGILSTVRDTRRALTEQREELAGLLRGRLDQMLSHGTTTVEVKSGYGLSTETELATLRLYQEVDHTHPVDLIPTFLGAHEIPPEFRANGQTGRTRYLDLLCQETLPAVAEHGLARFCDVFCEKGVFSVEESRRVLQRGIDLGLGAKIHCDQFNVLGGTALAAELGMVSVDHLHVTPRANVRDLAAGGAVAVGLPGVTYFLGIEDATPWLEFHQAKVPVALATDFNPGTCMSSNLQIIASIASSRWRMPDTLILRGLTIEAARAVGRADEIGSLATGKLADLLILDCDHEGELTYHFGVNHVETVIKAGQVVVKGGRLA